MTAVEPTTMLTPRASAAMVNFIVFEIVDFAATLAAASMLLKMIVARPAVRPTPGVVAELCDIEEVDGPLVELCGSADDGISWPERLGLPGLPATGTSLVVAARDMVAGADTLLSVK
jgi:hypothetical protein